MSQLYEVGIANLPYPTKGHDRYFIDPSLDRYVVFDGAGTDGASELAYKTTKELSQTIPDLDIWDVFRSVQGRLLRSHGGNEWTTGTGVEFTSDLGEGREVSIAHAGDSRAYLECDGKLLQVTEDEAPLLYDGRVDVANFLGSKTHDLNQRIQLKLPARHFSLLITTDGLVDPRYPGFVSDTDIHEVLSRNISPQRKADYLALSSQVPDDIALMVIEPR